MTVIRLLLGLVLCSQLLEAAPVTTSTSVSSHPCGLSGESFRQLGFQVRRVSSPFEYCEPEASDDIDDGILTNVIPSSSNPTEFSLHLTPNTSVSLPHEITDEPTLTASLDGNTVTCTRSNIDSTTTDTELNCSCVANSGIPANRSCHARVVSLLVISVISAFIARIARNYRKCMGASDIQYQTMSSSELKSNEKGFVGTESVPQDVDEKFDDSNYPMG